VPHSECDGNRFEDTHGWPRRLAEVEVKIERKSDVPHLGLGLSLNLLIMLADFFTILPDD
jgi:hypothetical protein